DGIRDFHVTGVQTCALPISVTGATYTKAALSGTREGAVGALALAPGSAGVVANDRSGALRKSALTHAARRAVARFLYMVFLYMRSEERRVGKEGMSVGRGER